MAETGPGAEDRSSRETASTPRRAWREEHHRDRHRHSEHRAGAHFFTQLWWKVPPEFGCRQDFETGGLCFWVDREISHVDDYSRTLLTLSKTS